MKIGILTHPLRTNYGGVLQNYALQTVLRRMGHDVVTIDRHNDKSALYLLLSFVKRNVQHHLLGKKHIPTNYYINLTRKQFLYVSRNIQHFIGEHIQTSPYLSTNGQLKMTLKYGFDCYVVGSDQVWLKQYVPTTFLDFLGDSPVKRIIYAASGRLDWLQEGYKLEQCRALAQKFDAVSVREASSIETCRKYLGIEATHVLDPTMLLTKEDYLSLIRPDHSKPRKGVLMSYILDPTPQKQAMIETLRDRLGLTPLEVRPKEKEYKQNIVIDDLTVPPIEEWIAGFRDAEFVITDSFHGMVFSIIFNKQFLVVGNKKRGISRFLSILSLLGISNRLIYEDSHLDTIIDTIEDINFEEVNKIIENKKQASLRFISDATR